MTPERAVLGAIPTVRFAEIRRLPHSAHRSDRLRQRCAIRSSCQITKLTGRRRQLSGRRRFRRRPADWSSRSRPAGYRDAKRSNVSGYFCAMRMRAAADSGGLDRPCSQRSTVRMGTRIMWREDRSGDVQTVADVADDIWRELREGPWLDADGLQGALAGAVLADFAESVERPRRRCCVQSLSIASTALRHASRSAAVRSSFAPLAYTVSR